MKKRFNLYYLLFEDQRKNEMAKEVADRIREMLNHFFSKDRQKPSLPAANEELN